MFAKRLWCLQVGKTSMITRFATGAWTDAYKKTIGTDFMEVSTRRCQMQGPSARVRVCSALPYTHGRAEGSVCQSTRRDCQTSPLGYRGPGDVLRAHAQLLQGRRRGRESGDCAGNCCRRLLTAWLFAPRRCTSFRRWTAIRSWRSSAGAAKLRQNAGRLFPCSCRTRSTCLIRPW